MDIFEPVCIFTCQDCEEFLVGLPEFITLFSIDEDLYGLTRCPYCDRVTKNKCTQEVAEVLIFKGVKLFDWNEGIEIE